MSIHQLNIYGKSLLEVSVERLKAFEPKEGYYLAFSGGKDSVVIKALADMAGVKYDAFYTVTSVDPPELVQFIKKHHPDVHFKKSYYPDDYKNENLRGKQITMWNLIPEKKTPPTRVIRYCCDKLKEHTGGERFVVTGVRKSESAKRNKLWGGLALAEKKSHKLRLFDPDQPTEELMYHCQTYARKVLNPIIDWTEDEVWEFIHEYNVPYCKLYDQGFKRLGCIGCPIGGYHMREEFDRWPKYYDLYLKAFERMVEERKKAGLEESWKSGKEVMEWWVRE